MSFWTAAVIIVVVVTLSGIYRSKLKANAEKSEGFFEDLSQRIARLEDRMANLETIVLEKERTKEFNEI
jgi:hypothetical protein